jgi:hypothetical protein
MQDMTNAQAIAAIVLNIGVGQEVYDILSRVESIEKPAAQSDGPTVPLADYEAACERLESIIDSAGCTQLPEINLDLDQIATEAADAAYEAAREAVQNGTDALDTSELDDAQDQIDAAVEEARSMRDEMRRVIESARDEGESDEGEREEAGELA